jgi:hypothetical protein
MDSVVVRQIAGLGRILEEPFSFLKADPDDECVRFRRAMGSQTDHEGAARPAG